MKRTDFNSEAEFKEALAEQQEARLKRQGKEVEVEIVAAEEVVVAEAMAEAATKVVEEVAEAPEEEIIED